MALLRLARESSTPVGWWLDLDLDELAAWVDAATEAFQTQKM